MMNRLVVLVLLAVSFLVSGCKDPFRNMGNAESARAKVAEKDELVEQVDATKLRHLTIIGTNDIHGGIEPQKRKGGELVGGLAIFAGAVKAIRAGVEKKYGERGGVLVLDAGDQFQGTLISNFTEGDLVFSAMNEVGYDAAITGNHDYDFGPIGWLEDKVSDKSVDKNPRGALEALIAKAKFPLISANTYLKQSIVDANGVLIDVDNNGCAPAKKSDEAKIAWSAAKRPAHVSPYVIKDVAGLKVALIGLDNPHTPSTTTIENVSDLCFRDEFAAYKEVRAELAGKADVFVLVIHDGNSNNEFGLSDLVRKLKRLPGGGVDAVIAGHTHFVNHVNEDGIRAIQSGSDGERFGRIDLVYNVDTKKVDVKQTQSYAGVALYHSKCDDKIKSFCAVDTSSGPLNGTLTYEGEKVEPSQRVLDAIADARAKVAPLATRVIGQADAELTRNRTEESAMANALTDAFRKASGAEISFMNTGGIRENFQAGVVTYEDLFRVLPFNNHGLTIGPMPWGQIKKLLQRSIETCGLYGALMQSGLNVKFTRSCGNGPTDSKAKLARVETTNGEVLLDLSANIEVEASRTFVVATLDFLAVGGSGYDDFKGTPFISDLGIVREVMTDEFLKHSAHWTGALDNRWVNLNSPSAPH